MDGQPDEAQGLIEGGGAESRKANGNVTNLRFCLLWTENEKS